MLQSPSKSPSRIEIARLPTPDVDDTDDDELELTLSINSAYIDDADDVLKTSHSAAASLKVVGSVGSMYALRP